jgi:hypothetical protein
MEVKKSFSLGNVKLEVAKNDFDELGSIVQLGVKSAGQQIVMSFYNSDRVQISQKQIIFITNSEFSIFDNVYILAKSDNTISIKLLNKEISFIKILALGGLMKGKKTSVYVIDINELEFVDDTTTHGSLQLSADGLTQNDNIAIILEELNRVNRDLIIEKDQLEKVRLGVKGKEDQIGNMILGFKKEILLHYDKCYSEASSRFNTKVADLNKKLLIIENNVLNKYKIIKDKINSKVEVKKVEVGSVAKDKTANLEIKIKHLEDSLGTMKHRITEKEELIKSLSENEDKMTRMVKKLKEDIVSMGIKLKQAEGVLKVETSVVTTTVGNAKPSKVKKARFDIPGKKEIITQLDNFVINILTLRNNEKSIFSDSDLKATSLLLLHIAVNPINLFNAFQNCMIILAKRLSDYINSISNKTLLQTELNNVINSFSELKKEIYSFTYSEIDRSKFAILNIYIGEKTRFNEVLLNRLDYFYSYLLKNDKKIIEKGGRYHFRLTKLCCLLVRLLFCYNESVELVVILKQVVEIICLVANDGNVSYILNFLMTINFPDLLMNLATHGDGFNFGILKIYIDIILLFYSMGFNLFDLNRSVLYHFNEITLNKYIDWEKIQHDSSLIIFLNILSQYQILGFRDKLIKLKADDVIINNELIAENIDNIISTIK